MTAPNIDNLEGMLPYSVIMEKKDGNQNPMIVAGTKHIASSNPARLAIPRGVSYVNISTLYKGALTLVLADGSYSKDQMWWPSNPGGVVCVEATTTNAYIYFRAAPAAAGDRFNLVITPFPAVD